MTKSRGSGGNLLSLFYEMTFSPHPKGTRWKNWFHFGFIIGFILAKVEIMRPNHGNLLSAPIKLQSNLVVQSGQQVYSIYTKVLKMSLTDARTFLHIPQTYETEEGTFESILIDDVNASETFATNCSVIQRKQRPILRLECS